MTHDEEVKQAINELFEVLDEYYMEVTEYVPSLLFDLRSGRVSFSDLGDYIEALSESLEKNECAISEAFELLKKLGRL